MPAREAGARPSTSRSPPAARRGRRARAAAASSRAGCGGGRRTRGSRPPRPRRWRGRAGGGPTPTSRSTLNSSSVMSRFIASYCGEARYFSNSACQAAASSGGSAPVTGRHSVIDRPDSVSRVRPPTRIIATISTKRTASQTAMPRRSRRGRRAAGAARAPGPSRPPPRRCCGSWPSSASAAGLCGATGAASGLCNAAHDAHVRPRPRLM